METLAEIHKYYKERIRELEGYASDGHPWAFLMAACFIEYLMKLVSGKEETSADDYKTFVSDHLGSIDPRYKEFRYDNGEQDLPIQMYHVLRCGIIHSFSLVPDSRSRKMNGRVRSIVLGHRKNGEVHFQAVTGNGLDAVLFTAEDLIKDIGKVLDKIFFEDAPSNAVMEESILKRCRNYIPIMSLTI